MSDRIPACYDRYLRTFEQGDPDRIARLHSPEGIFWQRTDQPPIVGRAEIARAFRNLFQQWPQLTCHVRDVRFGSDFWVLDWVLEAHWGRVRFDCLDYVVVDEDDLVASKTTYVDLAQAQRQLTTPRGGAS